jgi:hypothetical protein
MAHAVTERKQRVDYMPADHPAPTATRMFIAVGLQSAARYTSPVEFYADYCDRNGGDYDDLPRYQAGPAN